MKTVLLVTTLMLSFSALAISEKCHKEAEASALAKAEADYGVAATLMFSTLLDERKVGGTTEYIFDVNLTDGSNYKVEVSKKGRACKIGNVYEDANG